ncbi:MAG: hypothetical protein ABUT20_38145 [Bacteroidota bacterium]
MKTKSTQQEILIVTGTSFSARQWCKNDDSGKSENLSDQEKLEEACWNGLLQEMLPEICKQEKGAEKLYLWQVRQASSFLELELANYPEDKDAYFSIDPYSFIATKSDN